MGGWVAKFLRPVAEGSQHGVCSAIDKDGTDRDFTPFSCGVGLFLRLCEGRKFSCPHRARVNSHHGPVKWAGG